MAKNTQPQDEQDAPWKKVLRQYFREATEFFFPEIAQGVDWTKPIEFLDKEFLKIAPDVAMGKQFADQGVAESVYELQKKALTLALSQRMRGQDCSAPLPRERGWG